MSELDPNSLLGKVEAILDALAEDGNRLGLSELARHSNVSKSSVHRICTDLVAWGVVERSGDGFRLGARLFELGGRVPSRRLLRETALPFMEDLLRACGHSIHLAVPLDDAVSYLDKILVHSSTPTPSAVASRAPLHATATGKAMLAFGDRTWREATLSGELKAYTPNTLAIACDVARNLADIRACGYSTETEEFVLGYASIGAPLIGLGGRLMGAISVTTGVDELDISATADAVVTTAGRITERLGGSRMQATSGSRIEAA